MQQFSNFLLLCLSALAIILSSLQNVSVGGVEGAKCAANGPVVEQDEMGKGKYKVEVTNRCPMCPVISIHLKCGNFPQSLVDPKLCKVLKFDDCIVNGGLPLQPLQKFSFNYTNSHMFSFYPSTWFFQCE